MGDFDLASPSLGTGGIAGWEHRPRLLDGGLQVDPGVPTSSPTTETQSPLSLGLPAITPPIAQDQIASVFNGGVPSAPAQAGDEGGQATPPYSLASIKEGLKVMGFSDTQIAKLTDEEIEDGISLEELRRLDPSKTIITDMAYNLLSQGGLGVNALGGVAADEDGIQLADVQRFLTEVVAPLVSGTGKSVEVIARFLRANKFRVISRHAAARAFRESTREKEGLWTTTDGTTTLSVKTLIDKYVRGELKGLAGKVLANILGHAVTDSDRLTEDQLANFFLTMYFMGKSDSPENIMSEAKDLPVLEGDSPAKLIEWLTKGAEEEIKAESSSQTSGASSETQKFESTAARDLALEEVRRALQLPIPDFNRAFDIYETVQRGNGELEGVLLGGETKKVRLEMDESTRKDALGQIAQLLTDYLAQKKGEQDLAGILAIYRGATEGYIEYEDRRIEISLSDTQRQEIAKKEAKILLELAKNEVISGERVKTDLSDATIDTVLGYLREARGLIESNSGAFSETERKDLINAVVGIMATMGSVRLSDQEGKPKVNIPVEDANLALRLLFEARSVITSNSILIETSTSNQVATLIATAVFGLSRAGGTLAPEYRAQIEALRAEIVAGSLDEALKEFIKTQGIPAPDPRDRRSQPNVRNVIQLDEACLMRWKREYVARIDTLLRGEAYTYRTAVGPNQTDSNRDGWFESRGPLPPEIGAEPTGSTPSTSPHRAPSDTGGTRARGHNASRIHAIQNARIREAVNGWPAIKQKEFFRLIDQGKTEQQAYSQLS
jgi:hypothetical protein